ncbi:phage morphogenesis protein [Tenacibaculum maritimum]|nr:phage morphogenesis protein [Tenacibaculum maritimum]MDB0601087.1 phage morphogenesis protein [Tenacibaculum maritimum]MDB0612168.1 phage morphogenesis protein [Tenacibaculum maritimum]
MDDLAKHIKKQAEELETFFKNEALDIIEVEGINHIEEAFDNQGFTDGSLEKWKPRKTTNKRGKDITRYKSNRRGKRGKLNQYGRRNSGRAILTGHNTGGNKLRTSYRGQKVNGGVEFHTDKEYAERHNEGTDGMPKRQHIGESEALNQKIDKKIKKQVDKIFK